MLYNEQIFYNEPNVLHQIEFLTKVFSDKENNEIRHNSHTRYMFPYIVSHG